MGIIFILLMIIFILLMKGFYKTSIALSIISLIFMTFAFIYHLNLNVPICF